MQNQVELYSDTSPPASPVARDLFPLLLRCAGSDPAASDPGIFSHPGLVRSAPRAASAAPQDAIFSLKVKARWPDLICPAKSNPAKSPTRDGGRLHGKGYTVGVAIGKGMGWNPSLHQKEHEKLVQKSIHSYKSIR